MRLVRKRNGLEDLFSSEKIGEAITNCFVEQGYSVKDVEDDIIDIVKIINSDLSLISVEDIQDKIELELMKKNPSVAKAYILYRDTKSRERSYVRNYNFLSKEFLNKYKHTQPPLTMVGMFTFLRTYSRFIPELGRRETYLEAVARSVDANVSFVYKIKPKLTNEEFKKYKKEAEELFDNIFNCRQFLSGRLFWVGGTENTEKFPTSIYNCSFTKITDFEDFSEVMYLLSLGCGVGYRIFDEDVSQLNEVRCNVNILHSDYNEVPKNERLEMTEVTFFDNTATITVGDSRKGWCVALSQYFNIISNDMFSDIDNIIINYDNVRPYGEPLKTFGGRASGHTSLLKMFTKITRAVKDSEGKLTPLNCLDILGAIGQCIVAGGTRRSAMICLMEDSQNDLKEAKSKLYTLKDGKWVIDTSIDHRTMSNNSVIYNYKPTFEQISKHIDIQRYSGEPAMINGVEAKRRFGDFAGLNP